MMRKMAGTHTEDEMKYAAAAAAGFQRGLANNGTGNHTNIPPNMIPENMIYNPKFAASQGGFNFSQPALPNGGEPASHLHKMEGLLKPCYEDQQYGSYGNFHHPHHPHHYGGASGHMMDSFVNNFKNGPSEGVGGGSGVMIKQEGDSAFGASNSKASEVLMYGRSSNGNNPSSSNNNGSNLSSKEPNEFNLNYASGSSSKVEVDSDHLGGVAEDSIDKLAGLHDNDTEP